jgi:hypothetical protein
MGRFVKICHGARTKNIDATRGEKKETKASDRALISGSSGLVFVRATATCGSRTAAVSTEGKVRRNPH